MTSFLFSSVLLKSHSVAECKSVLVFFTCLCEVNPKEICQNAPATVWDGCGLTQWTGEVYSTLHSASVAAMVTKPRCVVMLQ